MCCCLTDVSITCLSSHNDVTLTQTLHSKSSTRCGNSDSTSHSIVFRSGLEISVFINRLLAKICCSKLGVALILNKAHDFPQLAEFWQIMRNSAAPRNQHYTAVCRLIWVKYSRSWATHLACCAVQRQGSVSSCCSRPVSDSDFSACLYSMLCIYGTTWSTVDATLHSVACSHFLHDGLSFKWVSAVIWCRPTCLPL